MRTCNHCGDTFPDFDVAHVCSKGQYAPKLPAPNLRKAAQELLTEYDAQRFVSIFHTQIEALRVALQSCPDCGKPPPDSIHTCLPQQPDDWEGIAADQALTIAMLQLDKQCLLEGLQYAVKQVPSLGDVPGIRAQLAAVPNSDTVNATVEAMQQEQKK